MSNLRIKEAEALAIAYERVRTRIASGSITSGEYPSFCMARDAIARVLADDVADLRLALFSPRHLSDPVAVTVGGSGDGGSAGGSREPEARDGLWHSLRGAWG